MKPTDIWTNHPNPQFKPPCHNGDQCHVRAPRGAKTGTQGLKGSLERSRIPRELCEHIVKICEWGCSTTEDCSMVEDEPQTEYRIGYYTPTNAEILKALEDEQSGKE